MATSLERRVTALESAVPTKAALSVVLITPMARAGHLRVPEVFSVAGMTLRREGGEDGAVFERQVAAAARESSPNGVSIAVCIESTEHHRSAEIT